MVTILFSKSIEEWMTGNGDGDGYGYGYGYGNDLQKEAHG